MNIVDTYNILHIILNLERAGAQEVVRILAYYQKHSGCKVTVCALRDGPLRERIEASGADVVILPGGSRVFPAPFVELARFFNIRRELQKLVRERNIHIVQTHLIEIFDFATLVLKKPPYRCSVFWTIHNVDFLPVSAHQWVTKFKRWLHRILYRYTVRYTDGFIAVSDDVREAILAQIGPVQDAVLTIPNGIDVERFAIAGDKAALCASLELSSEVVLFATVGRLTEQKGHSYLIAAAEKIVPKYPYVHFIFVGDGELRESLQIQVQEAGVSAYVHFLGIRNDIPWLLASVDGFILPSLWEGLSIALLEAMAAGKAVIATCVSGTTQVIQDSKTGLLVPPGDTESLAQAISVFLDDPERAQVMAQDAKRYVVERFSAQKQNREYLKLYRQSLAQSSTEQQGLG